MSNFNFNFSEAYKNVFGGMIYAGPKVYNSETIKPVESLQPLQLRSQTGVPIWDYVELLPKIIEGTGEQFQGYLFPFETVVEAILPKKIVTTDIFGSDGEVEELMGIGDWEINIRGFIINYETNDYPEAQVRELTRVCKLKDTIIDVEGTYLNILGINALSIHRFSPRPTPGYKNMQAFEIEARSKQPFIIDVENGISM